MTVSSNCNFRSNGPRPHLASLNPAVSLHSCGTCAERLPTLGGTLDTARSTVIRHAHNATARTLRVNGEGSTCGMTPKPAAAVCISGAHAAAVAFDIGPGGGTTVWS